MNPDGTAEMSLDESVATLLSGLPGPVQAFVLGPDRPRIALELSKKYSLHVDQAGAFETAYIHMLLGISSPEEFVDALTKAGVPPESVRGLAQDVNEQVFLPLRKAEQAEIPAAVRTTPTPPAILPGSNKPVPVVVPKPIEAAVPAPVVTPPPPVDGYQGQPQHVYGYIPQQMPPPMMYAPSYAVPPGYGAPVYMMPPQPPVQGWPQQAPAQLQQPPSAPAPAVEAPTPQESPVRVVAPPPERIPAPAPQTQPKATLNPGAHIEKNYSADPYREPFTQ
jgi:hypothetical protein